VLFFRENSDVFHVPVRHFAAGSTDHALAFGKIIDLGSGASAFGSDHDEGRGDDCFGELDHLDLGGFRKRSMFFFILRSDIAENTSFVRGEAARGEGNALTVGLGK